MDAHVCNTLSALRDVHRLSEQLFRLLCCQTLLLVMPGRPRAVTGDAMRTLLAGGRAMSEELLKAIKQTRAALLVSAILQTTFALLIIAVALRAHATAPVEITSLAAILIAIAALFWGLSIWARSNPLPPAIVGLAVYITVHVIEALLNPTILLMGWLVRVTIIVMLVQAIQAGLRHRQLMRERSPAGVLGRNAATAKRCKRTLLQFGRELMSMCSRRISGRFDASASGWLWRRSVCLV